MEYQEAQKNAASETAKVTPQFYDREAAAFVRHNEQYYMRVFEKLGQDRSPFSWNWGGFLWGSGWFFYRKMYALGAGLMVAQFLSAFYAAWHFSGGATKYIHRIGPQVSFNITLRELAAWFQQSTPLLLFAALVWLTTAVFGGLLGNYFYKAHLDKHLAVSASLSPVDRSYYYENKGGADILYPILAENFLPTLLGVVVQLVARMLGIG